VDSQTVAHVQNEVQHPSTSKNPDFQLNPAAKRLLLSAHLNLVAKKLRRGLSVEEQEVLALLPFTVPNGWQDEHESALQSDEDDQRWLNLMETARALG
jgi:hypothetical protein